jgi:hypothetical protein
MDFTDMKVMKDNKDAIGVEDIMDSKDITVIKDTDHHEHRSYHSEGHHIHQSPDRSALQAS